MTCDAYRSTAVAFQSTPPRRGRPRDRRVIGPAGGVSIHAPAKGATIANGCADQRCFNPRPREGGDHARRRRQPSAEVFQSTPPRRGRRGICGSVDHGEMFQSTPPRRGRPGRQPSAAHADGVSIHAPAKGATPASAASSADHGFNPRPREGGDMRSRSAVRRRRRVSIHAPAKGATRREVLAGLVAGVSIHAPAKGATAVTRAISRSRHVSIHAPAKGATPAASMSHERARRFNPRPREGGDDGARRGRPSRRFNPRPREGGDHSRCRRQPSRAFQSTPPRRGRR